MGEDLVSINLAEFIDTVYNKPVCDGDFISAVNKMLSVLHISYMKVKFKAAFERTEDFKVSHFGNTGFQPQDGLFDIEREFSCGDFYKFSAVKAPDYPSFSDADLKNSDTFFKLLMSCMSRMGLAGYINRTSEIDMMTGILNVNGIFRNVMQKMMSGKLSEYSFMFINIKKFKLVNRFFNFSSGNTALVQFAQRCREFLGDDQYIARPGGDNFMAFLRTENVEKFFSFMTDFTLHLKRNGEPADYNISVYAGVYNATGNEQQPIALSESASIAYNFARIPESSDLVYFTQDMHDKYMREKEIEAMLKPALQNGEFTVYYQPKVSLEDYRLVGAEALVRWKREGKVISPGEFIPICEKNGFVCQIDFYIYEKVCQNIRKWLDDGVRPVRISSNFSKLHFSDSSFAEKLVKIADAYNVPHDLIEIEFTETTSMEDYQKLNEAINFLHENGICSSMDDFGSGYSSLNLLRDTPVDILKLDKEFMNKENVTEREHIVLRNVVRMANELNIDVISEGVETDRQMLFLKEISCNKAQGYLFDRPLPQEEFEERLKKGGYTVKFT